MAVPEKASGVFGFALQNLAAFKQRIFLMAAKTDALERLRAFGETAAASLARRTLEKADMVCKLYERHATMESLNTDLMALREQIFCPCNCTVSSS